LNYNAVSDTAKALQKKCLLFDQLIHCCRCSAAPGFGLEALDAYGTLNSMALHMPPPPVPTRPRSAGSARPPSPAAAAGSSCTAAVDLAGVQAGMLAHVAKGGNAAPGSSGAVVQVATPRGCWMGFYDEIASILLGDAAVAVAAPQADTATQKAAQQAQQKTAAADASLTGGDSAADAPAGEVSSSVGISSRLSVRPEQAAEVIRLIEAAMQSSREGRTIQL
jgi:hypothetical protein